MCSQNFLRAGLVVLTVSLYALFALAAPLPSTSLSCSLHPQSCLIAKRDLLLEERSDIDFDLDSRSFFPPSRLNLRDDIDQPVTYARRNFFTDAFKKIGNGIKNVAQKVGNGVKTAVNKVAGGVKTVAKKVGNGVKQAAKKVAGGVKTAVKKVGNGVKNATKKVANGAKNVVKKAVKTAKKVATSVKTAAKKVATGVKTAVKKVANGAKKAAKKVVGDVKNAAKKVAGGVKTAVKKAGDFAKKTGPMVGKFGLKVLSTAQSVASLGAKFIPGFGTPISLALKAGSIGTNVASNAIKADLPGNLQQGMKIMDKIQHPLSGAAGAVLSAIPRELDESELDILSREYYAGIVELRDDDFDERSRWAEFEERDAVLYELDARYSEAYEWESREWNEWE